MKTEDIKSYVDTEGLVILPPMDVFEAVKVLKQAQISVTCSILDPWYNKGIGGELPIKEYDQFIQLLLDCMADISDILYLWGFAEVIGPYVRYAPKGFQMSAWLTWYYKNCPSVIRGWRSSQNACLQFVKEDTKLHPEHFLTPEQLKKYNDGKMRFIPGPPTVIEEPLIIGFVGKDEQTGHPAQKPEAVFKKLILMSTLPGEIVFDPMVGSGTTAAAAIKNGRRAIVCDKSEEYIKIVEMRMGKKRISLDNMRKNKEKTG